MSLEPGDASPIGERSVRRRALVVLSAAGVLYLAAWSGLLAHGPVTCGFRRLTGFPCWGCGLTRAATALAHADVRTATALHLAAVPLALVTAGGLAIIGVELVTGRDLVVPLARRRGRALGLLLAGVLATGWAANLAARLGHPLAFQRVRGVLITASTPAP